MNDRPDSALAVKGITSGPRYAVGDQPKFTMVVTNVGLTSCRRDVGAAVLAAYVYTLDNKRLWLPQPRLRAVQRDTRKDVEPG